MDGQTLKIMLVGTIVVVIYILYVSTPMVMNRMDSNSKVPSVEDLDPMEIRDFLTMPMSEVTTVIPNTSKANCQSKKNLFLLKTHKSGSSTLQNILLRYADKHNLTLVLPKTTHQLGYPNRFNRRFAIPVPWNEYNMFCQHSRFNLPEVMELMPDDTVFVTILREPVAHFESLFTYYNIGGKLRIREPSKLEQFLRNPEKYVQRRTYKTYNSTNPYLRNNYMFDLGFNEEQWKTNSQVTKLIERVDQIFDLVLIMEYFDESLILLRYTMCWDIDSLVYFRFNIRKETSVYTNISHWMQGKIRRWNSADAQLYSYFNETFWKKVKAFGEQRMEEELQALKERTRMYWDTCIGDVTADKNGVHHAQGVDILIYSLKNSAKNNKDCVQMTKAERFFTYELTSKLKKRIRSHDYHQQRSQHIFLLN
ncbi:galactose-3-O-sulfotransferase 2-like [Glandiceps talaboti]